MQQPSVTIASRHQGHSHIGTGSPPLSAGSHAASSLQDLPPLIHSVPHKNAVSHLSLDDLLDPLVEEQHLDKKAKHDKTRGRESKVSKQASGGATFPTELLSDYSDDFSSHKGDGEDTPEVKSLRYTLNVLHYS